MQEPNIKEIKIAYTLCSVSHLGQAKAMADSFIEHNVNYKLIIGVVDKLQQRIDTKLFDGYELIEIEEMGIPNLPTLAQKYNGLELCCLAKPFMATYLFRRFASLQKLIYIDTDILIFGSMQCVENELDTASILITPHITSPYEDTKFYPKEIGHLNAGLYNAGFFALKRSQETERFLNWWQYRLVEFGYVNFMDGMFVDQNWLNFVPLFFQNTVISINAGLNVAYWNLHERSIEIIDNQYVVNKKYPLIFFHYSGYKTSLPNQISAHTDRFTFENKPELRPIFERYHQSLLKNKHDEFLKLSNLLIPEKSYMKWGKIREYALRLARKTIREWHG